RTCSQKVHRMKMKTAISCTMLRHTKILIAVGVCIISLATLGSKNHTTNITKIVTQSIGIIINRLKSAAGKGGRAKTDKPPTTITFRHAILKRLKAKPLRDFIVEAYSNLEHSSLIPFFLG